MTDVLTAGRLQATFSVRSALAWLLFATSLAAAYVAVVVPPGLPYDEPAHWANVLFIVQEHRLPVLGEPGVHYEGQQTPLYYVLATLLSGSGDDSGFYSVRMLGVVGHVILTWLTAQLLRSTAPSAPAVAWLGAAFIGLNPMLLVMGASVQNDTWALVFAFGALALASSQDTTRPLLQSSLVGLLGGLAVLTKLTMAPVVIALVICYAARRDLLRAAMVAVTAGATMTWWVLRNMLLYGDLTGQSAVARTGAIFENVTISGLYVAQTVLTYLTLPTEYLRNTISAPAWVDLVAIGLGIIILTGFIQLLRVRRQILQPWPWLLAVVTAGTSFVAWLTEILLAWPVAFRTAYGVLPLVALSVGATATLGTHKSATRVALIVVLSAQLAVGAWVVWALLTQDVTSPGLINP